MKSVTFQITEYQQNGESRSGAVQDDRKQIVQAVAAQLEAVEPLVGKINQLN